MKATAWLQGLALGAGLMYMFDPERGKRRRALVRDQGVHFVNKKRNALRVMQRDFTNRARGVARMVQGKVNPDHPEDMLLRERVRSAMGRYTSHAGAIQVDVQDCVVTLSGPILMSEAQGLIRCVQGVRGVERVINNLDLHETAEGVSSLQGGGTRGGMDRWTPAECLIGIAGGTVLTLMGMSRRGLFGTVMGLAGVALIGKSFSDTEHRFDPRGNRTGGTTGTGNTGKTILEQVEEHVTQNQ